MVKSSAISTAVDFQAMFPICLSATGIAPLNLLERGATNELKTERARHDQIVNEKLTARAGQRAKEPK